MPDTASHRGPAIAGFVLFVIAGALALSVDVPRAGYGIKSDEATYAAAAFSAAYDRDLTYTRGDYERFAGIFHSGPDGIFLKRGKQLKVRVNATPPFVHVTKQRDPRSDRLYFGKAVIYPVVAAPFVRLFGLNGMLLFHVFMLALVGVAAYLFLAAQMSPAAAVTFTTAFLAATELPVYAVFLMPEIFNFTLVFLAYFLWLHKEVAPDSRFAGRWTDFAAAILLGIGTYSKPVPMAVLVAPLVAYAWVKRRWVHGFAIGALAVVAAALLFAWTAAISGEFNYQGGDRKTFYARFPFDSPTTTWEELGGNVIDDPGTAAQDVLVSPDLPRRFALNVKYFLVGRHFGLIPYFFPGCVAVAAWLLSARRRDWWRVLTFGAVALSAIVLLLVLPFTWSGGGGPPGNRYFFNVYPALFFLIPPVTVFPGLLAWIGGALFAAKMLVDPFAAAKFTWQLAEKGPARRLPVELTMANDLPVMLAQPPRGHIHYGPYDERGMILYFLDQNSWPPEPQGMWVSGAGRTDVIVRTVVPVDAVAFEAQSQIQTTLTVAAGADPVTLTLQPNKPSTFMVKASGVRGAHDYNYLLTARSSDGFVPHVNDRQSPDFRNLGAQLRFRLISTALPQEPTDRTE